MKTNFDFFPRFTSFTLFFSLILSSYFSFLCPKFVSQSTIFFFQRSSCLWNMFPRPRTGFLLSLFFSFLQFFSFLLFFAFLPRSIFSSRVIMKNADLREKTFLYFGGITANRELRHSDSFVAHKRLSSQSVRDVSRFSVGPLSSRSAELSVGPSVQNIFHDFEL